jgi:arylsulfatase A-like enzyme
LFWRTQPREAARVGNWKYIKDAGAEHLFDLSTDPGEKTDLRTRHASTFEEIKKQYLSWNAKMLPRRTALQ